MNSQNNLDKIKQQLAIDNYESDKWFENFMKDPELKTYRHYLAKRGLGNLIKDDELKEYLMSKYVGTD